MGGTMTVREGDRIKSILTERVYEVKMIKGWAVVLRSLDGSNQVWTERGNLKLFYKKMEGEEVLSMPLSPAMKRPLRPPSKVGLDFV